MFEEGAKVRLRSCASGKNLRIQGGVPNGKGGEGPYGKQYIIKNIVVMTFHCVWLYILFIFILFYVATFIVHVRGPGVVSLQSVADLSKWLRIKQDGVLDGNVS